MCVYGRVAFGAVGGAFIAAEIKTNEQVVTLSSHQMVAKHFSGHEQQEYHE